MRVPVTTLRVVWIEILFDAACICQVLSPPCGWCGLKSAQSAGILCRFPVTTLRVVWIEILPARRSSYTVDVTTLRVVWIEMDITTL